MTDKYNSPCSLRALRNKHEFSVFANTELGTKFLPTKKQPIRSKKIIFIKYDQRYQFVMVLHRLHVGEMRNDA